MTVVKVRASDHSKDVHAYVITAEGGIVVGAALRGYEALLTGAAAFRQPKESSLD